MAGKTPVVMISSTVRDLHEHRQIVIDSCLRQNMFPKMMEHLAAAEDGGLAESLRLVDESDIYLGIIGHRYGHIPKGKTKSITHYEYERASKRGIPRLIFIMHEDHPVKANDVERGKGGDKLEQFKGKLQKEHSVNFFKSPDDLRTLVLNTLAAHDKRNSGAPPIPSASVDDETLVLSARLSINRDAAIIERIGCPVLELELVCRSKRPAKIAEAKLHVRGPHVLAAMQQAFSTDFGYDGHIQLIDEPTFFMSFKWASKPDTPHGFVIEQDDVRKFFMPVYEGSLLYFAEAPPTDVHLEVKHLDGRSETMLRGLDVQRELPALIRMIFDQKYHLHPAMVLEMGFNTKVLQMPDTPTPGFLNDNPFHLPPHPRRDDAVDEESDRIRLRARILRAGGEKDMACEDWLIGIVREHADKEVRRDAIVSLRRLATPKVRDLFFELLKSEFNEVTRELIIRSFAVFGIVEDIPIMGRMARDENTRFCREAATIAFQLINHRFFGPGMKATGQ